MRKHFKSAVGIGSVLALASGLGVGCSTKPSNQVVDGGAGGSGNTSATGATGNVPATGATGNSPATGGAGNAPSAGGTGTDPAGGAGPGSGGSGNATSAGGTGIFGDGGTAPVVTNDPSCKTSEVKYLQTLTPQDTRVPNLVSSLTNEQRLAMLNGGQRLSPSWWTIDFDATGAPSIGLKDMPMRDGPRGVHQLSKSKSTTWAVAEARAASFDLDLEYRVGAAQGLEMKAFKYDVSLAPTMNVLRHPGWGRAQETYGEDPVLVGYMAAAFVKGMQDKKMMACPKHFAVNNTENNRGDGDGEPNVNMIVDAQTLHENYTRNFEIVVEKSDPACIMAAYNRVNGKRCTQNPELITKIIRQEWRKDAASGPPWSGFIVSDWWATVLNQGTASLNAGLDLEMPDNMAYVSLSSDTTIGPRVSEAATRLVNARLKFAHETAAYKDSPPNPGIVNDATHIALAQETALKGAVLLKNDAILPLPKTGKSIVFLGPDALIPDFTKDNEKEISTGKGEASGLGDGGSSNTFPPYAVSFLDGLKKHPSGAALTITSKPNATDAATADIAIIPVTMSWDDEGEGYGIGKDRQDLTLSGAHPSHWGATKPAAFIKAAAAANPNVIVLLAVGSAIVMEDWMGSAKGIVQTFYPGQEGGNALAKLLFGDANFSGKLPFTVAQNPLDYPAFQNEVRGDAQVDYFHGYRKFEKDAKAPRFWFGFGLSYTKYTYGDVKVLCSDGIDATGQLNVEVPVTNAGAVAGDEVVQLYIGYPNTKVRRPKKELKTFKRVHLEPGETKSVQLSVQARDMRYWADPAGWTIEKGAHTVLVGPSADPALLKSAPFTIN